MRSRTTRQLTTGAPVLTVGAVAGATVLPAVAETTTHHPAGLTGTTGRATTTIAVPNGSVQAIFTSKTEGTRLEVR